jgi:hypothetical protein
MSDSVVLPVNRFTVAARALRQGGRTSDGWSTLACWKKDREQEPFPRLRSPGTSSVVPRIGCVWIVRLHLILPVRGPDDPVEGGSRAQMNLAVLRPCSRLAPPWLNPGASPSRHGLAVRYAEPGKRPKGRGLFEALRESLRLAVELHPFNRLLVLSKVYVICLCFVL